MQAREIELDEINRKVVINQKADMVVGAIDSATLTAIFIQFLTEAMREFLEASKIVFFPAAAAFSVIRAGLAWRQAKLANNDSGFIAKATVETVGALAITTAVIGGLVFQPIFAAISPIIFTATLAAKTLYHFGAASYYWAASKFTPNHKTKEKDTYREMAKGHAISTAVLTLVTPAVALAMIAAKPIMAALGVIGGAIATIYAVYKAFTTPVPAKPKEGYKPLLSEDQSQAVDADRPKDELTNGAKLQKTLAQVAVAPEEKSRKDQVKTVDLGVPEIPSQPQSPNGKSSANGLFAGNASQAVTVPAQKVQQQYTKSF